MKENGTVTIDIDEYNELRDFKRNLERRWVLKEVQKPEWYSGEVVYKYLNQECFKSDVDEQINALNDAIIEHKKINKSATPDHEIAKWSIWKFLKMRKRFKK